ncbi:MAG: serine/threonine-protein kinase [Acidobacteriota bacterium]
MRLSHLDVLSEVGRGEDAVVYRCRDRRDGSLVAAKAISATASAAVRRVEREAAVLSSLSHPGIPGFRGLHREQDRVLLVQELVEGETWPPNRQQAWTDLVTPLRSLLRALAIVHDAGLVHRDLKPENLRLHEDRAHLLDFGLCLAAGQDDESPATRDFIGTPRYAAPEQLAGTSVDARADLYSLGVLLFEALDGDLPHAGRGGELVRSRLFQPARPLAPELAPQEIRELIDSLLSRDPGDRPPSARAVLGTLSAVQELPTGAFASEPSLTMDEAHDWFRGPERFLHLQTDGAQALLHASGGERAEARRVLRSWMGRGLVEVVDGAVVISRETLGTIEELPLQRHAERVAQDDLESVLGTLALVESADTATLAIALQRSEGDVARSLARTLERGQVAEEAGRWHVLGRVPRLAPELTPLVARRLLRGDVLGSDRWRLAQLTSSMDVLAEEGAQRALTLRQRGDARRAFGLAKRVAWLGAGGDIRRELARCALQLGSSDHLSEVLDLVIEEARPLVEAALTINQGAHLAAEGALVGLAPREDDELESWRIALTVRAKGLQPDAGVQAFLDEHHDWAHSGSDDRLGRWQAWRGLAAYHRNDPRSAAEAHGQAVELREGPSARAASLVMQGFAFLDLGSLDEVEDVAQQAADLASTFRMPHHAVDAFGLIRAAGYRAARSQTVDREACAAMNSLGDPRSMAAPLVTEAAIAWRDGVSDALELALAAAQAFDESGRTRQGVLPRCLAALLGDRSRSLSKLVGEARRLTAPGLRTQSLALLRMAGARVEETDLPTLHLRWPAARAEVMSRTEIEEALEFPPDSVN